MNSEFPFNGGSHVKLGQFADFDLGGMRVMPARRQVRFGDETRTLEPRVMQVLVALAEARPAVVSRDHLAQMCWGGLSIGDDAINRCIVALRRLVRDFDPEPFTIETIPRVGYSLREAGGKGNADDRGGSSPKPGRRTVLLPVLVVAALLALGLLAWRPWQGRATINVAVAPAARTPEADGLARDLTAKLGMLSSVTDGPVRLLDGGKADDADLLFEVDISSAEQQVEMSLVLLNRKRELLWSKGLRRPRGSLADLRQQLAFTAGTVLRCALDTASDRTGEVDRQTRKIYLNACSEYAEMNEDNYRDLRAMFARITQSAPRFEPGWRRLLSIDIGLVRDFNFPRSQEALDRTQLKQDLTVARRLDPQIPEIFLGQAILVPTPAFSERLRLTDLAVANGPDDADLLMFRSRFLDQVGRMNDAVEDAKKAMRLDPLSPSRREDLVGALAGAGRIAEATEELRKAEQLWPGSANLLSARYALHLRFADPKEAIRIRNSGLLSTSGAPMHGSFLEARANPTPANVEKALRDARAYFSREPLAITVLSQALVQFGREDELFAVLLDGRQPYDEDDLLEVLFRPAFRKFHHDARMMQVAVRLGLLDYWQSSGKWPDFCFDPDIPYDCRREAAKAARKPGPPVA